ncbi:MAG: hypothetical protein LBI13_04290 [Streptococcaceae bacterium]|jgi:hypothetical protein|nr:hypothetical protein [Streptococcaceae bacterium]
MINKKAAILSILFGSWLLLIALISYGFQIIGNWELTFWSNLCAGALLLIAGIYELKYHRKLPRFLYFDAMLLLMLVFIFVMAFASQMNFAGSFLFLHIINPILMFLFWLLFIDHRQDKGIKSICSGLVLPLIYVVIVELFKNGYYPPLSVRENGLVGVLTLIMVFLGILLILAMASFNLNKFFHRIFQKEYYH